MTVGGRALMLPDRCDFVLRHCDQPMTARHCRTSWQGQYPDGTETTEAQYRCDRCGATAAMTVVEPDRAGLT